MEHLARIPRRATPYIIVAMAIMLVVVSGVALTTRPHAAQASVDPAAITGYIHVTPGYNQAIWLTLTAPQASSPYVRHSGGKLAVTVTWQEADLGHHALITHRYDGYYQDYATIYFLPGIPHEQGVIVLPHGATPDAVINANLTYSIFNVVTLRYVGTRLAFVGANTVAWNQIKAHVCKC